MAIFTFPTAAELKAIEQEKMPRLVQNRLGFQLMPFEYSNSHYLRWEIWDNFVGLQGARGLDGEPTLVKRIGSKVFQCDSGVYGDKYFINETDLTLRREMGTWNRPINIDDLVVQAQDMLLLRRLDRQEKTIWDLLTTGTFSILGDTGAVIYADTYNLQTYSAGVTWATSATATPLADFRAVKLKGRGKSVNFGTTARAYMNQTTFNQLISNANANDLYGRRPTGLSTILGLGDVNAVLALEDLPQLVIYDEGYLDETGAFQLFIPNNKVVVIGRRPAGQVIGNYRMTRNANNDDLGSYPYTKVFDNGRDAVPRKIAVHDGHNGGVVCYYPSAIVVMTV